MNERLNPQLLIVCADMAEEKLRHIMLGRNKEDAAFARKALPLVEQQRRLLEGMVRPSDKVNQTSAGRRSY